MSVPAKQIPDSEFPQAEILGSDLRAETEAPHYGLLALLAIALFAITVSQLDRIVAAPQIASSTMIVGAR